MKNILTVMMITLTSAMALANERYSCQLQVNKDSLSEKSAIKISGNKISYGSVTMKSGVVYNYRFTTAQNINGKMHTLFSLKDSKDQEIVELTANGIGPEYSIGSRDAKGNLIIIKCEKI